ncbi:MAG: TetR family transcriptional regulator [Actinomycetota bacterium]|nr:TetR family transcriptional regulator [Actinomycetota bacterium]
MQVTARASAASIARRSQIIEATIEAIADVGYVRASFVEIAKRAQISSTRLISYHFVDRDDLMAQVAAQVLGEVGSAVEARVRAADTPRGAVHRYIEANVEYMDIHRRRIRALTSLLFAGALEVPADQVSAGVDALTAIIRAGQQAGEFNDVDARVAATIVQRSVEGVALQLRDHPDADLSGYAQTLVRFFDAALTSRSSELVSR